MPHRTFETQASVAQDNNSARGCGFRGARRPTTQAEVVKKAADAWRRTKLTPGVKKFFERWFRVFK